LPITTAWAQDILLTIDGNIEGDARGFSDADLQALPQVEFETSTIWTEGTQRFSGPTVASLLEAVGAGEGNLTLMAINDYIVEMPRDVVEASAPIIATRIDGEPFSRRDKGPLWLVFPYDSDARFRAESLYAYSVWQLVGITID
jgi:hypothetical protein